MNTSPFSVAADFAPTGDQPEAIERLLEGYKNGARFQTLEGVTGSGKTFTMANVIAGYGKPALIISHNKTLAAQLYAEFKHFFPNNSVQYFVSYFDYYQPEAYIPRTDTFIEKDSAINDEIERLRLAATDALMNRKDVILIASVSCIYGLGSPNDYKAMLVSVRVGDTLDRDALLEGLVATQYTRNELEKSPGTFRVMGDTVEVYPSYNESCIRLSFFGDEVESISELDRLTGKVLREMEEVNITPARHFVTPYDNVKNALGDIRKELEERVTQFEKQQKLLEAQRIRMRTEYDMELLQEVGFCSGIENYSRFLTGREPGQRPYTLLDFFEGDFLTIIDESHVTIPQLNGMYNGDIARKQVLVEHGFRLPSALDNRPLQFQEFLEVTGPMLFVSATPGPYEIQQGGEPVKQIIRPTGIIDPEIEIRPLKHQIDDLMEEIKRRAEQEERTLVTTLTKKTAEDLTDYLRAAGLRIKYLHSDIDTVERVEILRSLRRNEFDALIGINLLREGLDLPEVTLVAILDADKAGFLRSKSALIQTAGRAARNVKGRVILYADEITDSMQALLDVTRERREKQLAYNQEHHITPKNIVKEIQDSLREEEADAPEEEMAVWSVQEKQGAKTKKTSAEHLIVELEEEMQAAAKALEFERAAILRDQLLELKALLGPEKSTSKTGHKKASYPMRKRKKKRS